MDLNSLILRMNPKYLDSLVHRALVNPSIKDDIGFNSLLRAEAQASMMNPSNGLSVSDYRQQMRNIIETVMPKTWHDDFSNYRSYQKELEDYEIKRMIDRTMYDIEQVNQPFPGKYDRLEYLFRQPSRQY